MASPLERLEALRQSEAAKRQNQAEQTRTILADAGLLGFVESMREAFGAVSLKHVRHGDTEIGKPGERGVAPVLFLDKPTESTYNATKIVQATSGRKKKTN